MSTSCPPPETPSETGLFETILMLGKLLGLSRSVATVFASLYSTDDGLTIDSISAQSGLSKSAVSLALRDLMQMGAAQERLALGQRSRHYCGQPDLGDVVTEMVIARLRYPLSELREKAAAVSGPPDRLSQVRALIDTVDSTLADIQAGK